jgi:uncharacterized protein YecE (DUF72 family)
MYFSIYTDRFLRALARQLGAEQTAGTECWCVFDNTAHGGAVPNALRTRILLGRAWDQDVARALNSP